MTDQEALDVFIENVEWYDQFGDNIPKVWKTKRDAYSVAVRCIKERDRIKEIVARALRSQDPINLYKAQSLNEIADILEIKIDDDNGSGSQIDIFDILT